jgi:oligopeptide transport system substrate-binding protein
MNRNQRQLGERRRGWTFVGSVCLCRKHFGVLGFLLLLVQTMTGVASGSDAPKRGGTLHFATEADPNSLDPARIVSGEEGTLACCVFNGLYDLDSDGKVQPMLAEALPEISSDALTYTIRLRPGVCFSNGRELTADDVVYSLERFLDPMTGSPEMGYFRGIRGGEAFVNARLKEASSTNKMAADAGRWIEPMRVEGLRALNPRTVQIQSDQPNVALTQILAAVFSGIVPREAVALWGNRFGAHPLGTGPFILKEWVRGVRLRFERNPNYFRPGEPYLDAIEVLANVDWSTQAMMIERGELDVEFLITDPDFLRFRKAQSRQLVLESVKGTLPTYAALNCELPPFTNRLVRVALNHAVNKDALARKMLNRAVPARGPLPMNVRGFNPDLPEYSYNPTRARTLLAEAGFPNGFEITLWAANSGVWRNLAQMVQHDLKAVGVVAHIKEVTWPTLNDNMQRRKNVAIGLTDWGASINDPKDTLDSLLNGDAITDQACLNWAFYSNTKVQELFRVAAVEANPDRRIQQYQEIEQLIVQDAPWLFLCHRNTDTIRQKWLKGFRPRGFWPILRLETTWIDK